MKNQEKTITCLECNTTTTNVTTCPDCGELFKFILEPTDKCYHCGDPIGGFFGTSTDPAPYGICCEPCATGKK